MLKVGQVQVRADSCSSNPKRSKVQHQVLMQQQKITSSEHLLQQYQGVFAGQTKALQKHSAKAVLQT